MNNFDDFDLYVSCEEYYDFDPSEEQEEFEEYA